MCVKARKGSALCWVVLSTEYTCVYDGSSVGCVCTKVHIYVCGHICMYVCHVYI